MARHLAIFSKSSIKQIFSGKKTVETRFSKKRIAPFAQISVGDIIYIKPPGEEVVGQFTAKKVISFEGIEEGDWAYIKKQFGKKMALGTEEEIYQYFNKNLEAKFGTIILMDNLEQFITSPLKVEKKDLRGWMVLD